MPIVKFIDLEGAEHTVEAEIGQSVMQVGIANLVPDLVSECGGNCACASCHALVDEGWLDRLEPPQQLEADMLTCVQDYRSNSRLTCQIKMRPELDGLIVRVVNNGY
ncbi:MAG: (2Fe-2S)-binding protein [Betaproteobacteria bacterium HGW-Betaproteobacteria-4]|jgi:2Fe-2S ferredoxin|nr:MAG: (2Fe-2S)-binding protein [Betaproteobacteria bacterium HGW-Betaproteobacteria-4]